MVDRARPRAPYREAPAEPLEPIGELHVRDQHVPLAAVHIVGAAAGGREVVLAALAFRETSCSPLGVKATGEPVNMTIAALNADQLRGLIDLAQRALVRLYHLESTDRFKPKQDKEDPQ